MTHQEFFSPFPNSIAAHAADAYSFPATTRRVFRPRWAILGGLVFGGAVWVAAAVGVVSHFRPVAKPAVETVLHCMAPGGAFTPCRNLIQYGAT